MFVGLGEFKAGKPHKMDGWGPILGDFGSGFQLAVDGFRFIGRSYDEGKRVQLFKQIRDWNNKRGKAPIRGILHVQTWFDNLVRDPQNWRIRFAQLAEPITQAADSPQPDPDAVKLVRTSALDMAKTIEIALQCFGERVTGLPIVFQGGMFEHSDLYRKTVANKIRDRYANKIRMATFRTVLGAALMGYTDVHGPLTESWAQTIRQSIRRLGSAEAMRVSYPDNLIEQLPAGGA